MSEVRFFKKMVTVRDPDTKELKEVEKLHIAFKTEVDRCVNEFERLARDEDKEQYKTEYYIFNPAAKPVEPKVEKKPKVETKVGGKNETK